MLQKHLNFFLSIIKQLFIVLIRIKEITGMNFEDAEEMLLVQIGLKITELLEREKIQNF